MGVYSLDKASPKKAAAGLHRTGFSDLKRRLVHRRFFCVWVFLALVPCYLIRQMFSYETPAASSHGRITDDELSSRISSQRTFTEKDVPYEKPTEVKIPLEKSAGDIAVKLPATIKPAQYDSIPPPLPKAKENMTGNSLQLKLKDNFEDDEDFGVPEDNERNEEQFWKAPPSPSKKPKVRSSRR